VDIAASSGEATPARAAALGERGLKGREETPLEPDMLTFLKAAVLLSAAHYRKN
jgi:hypothetical protein